jgi:hypothetical protein
MMKVEVLYFQGCPNQAPTVERVRAVLEDEGVTADILQVEVQDSAEAESLGFLGSPSVRINGTDVEASSVATQAAGLTCRTYMDGSVREGVPPVEVIRRAVRDANRNKNFQ